MKCENREELLVASLYGELSGEEEERVQDHIASCAECREEWETLQSTAGLLRQWEDTDSPVRYRMAAPPIETERRSSRSSRKTGLLRRLRRSTAPAYIVAAAALLLVVFNLNLSVDNGRLTVGFGREATDGQSDVSDAVALDPSTLGGVPLGIPVGSEVSRYVSRDDFLQSQGELIRFVATLIRESEDRQIENLGAILQEYLQEVEMQRETDLGMLGAKVDEVERSTRNVLQSLVESDSADTDPMEEEGER